MNIKRFKWWQWLLIIAGVLLFAILLLQTGRRIYWHNWHKNHSYYNPYSYENTYPECWISDNISFRRPDGCYCCDGFLYDSKWKVDYYTPALRWVQWTPADSLAVGAIAGRRAYFNRYNGEQVLPFDYTRAWFFSEGVAAVTDTLDNLYFINKKGDRAICQTFHYSPSMRYEGYMFHNGYCIMNDGSDRKGMIDRNGNWSIAPTWDMIIWRDGYWELRRNDSIALLDTMLHTIMPKTRATESRMYGDGNIFVEIPNKPSRIYTMQGRLVSDKVYAEVTPLLYRADHQVDYPNDTVPTEMKPSACSKYTNMAGEKGLLDKNGRMLTDAIYYDIKALDYGLFRAQVTFYPNNIYVMLDTNGREVR